MKNETERSNENNNITQETSVAQDIVQLLLKIAFIRRLLTYRQDGEKEDQHDKKRTGNQM